jgi:putative Holliday junction resolvase
VAAESIGELVVGLPLEASGVEGPQAATTRAWAETIAGALRLPVVYRDERLTSHLAEQRVGPIGRGRSGGPPGRTRRDAYRARIDQEAAAIILQDELDARADLDGPSVTSTAPMERR